VFGTQEVLMKRKWIIAVAVVAMLVGGAAVASAQFRMDIDVPWWIRLDLSPALEAELTATGGVFEGVDISQFAVVVPNIQAYFTFGGPMLTVGVGARLYTLLLINFLYPSIMGEVRLGDFDVNLNVGGLAGVLLGIGPIFETATGGWATFDLSAGYRITNWFRVGAGVFGGFLTDYPEYFPYVIYASAKFIVNPGKKTKVVEED
jgi:hypothetical protein